MPYADTLACRVADYLVAEGFEVRDYVNLRVTDNTEVGRIPSNRVLDAFAALNANGVDQIVLSACVQMPSFAALPEARRRSGTPITSAAECTAKQLMRRLGIAYAVGATLALYLNLFVLIVQSFQKITILQPLAPTQCEPPFVIAQTMLLIAAFATGVLAVRAAGRPAIVPAA